MIVASLRVADQPAIPCELTAVPPVGSLVHLLVANHWLLLTVRACAWFIDPEQPHNNCVRISLS